MSEDRLHHAIRETLKRPVAFHRVFAKVAGGATAGLMLSQMWYWADKGDKDGWFYKSQEEWEEETGLTRYEQETARRDLKSRGILEERRAGMPARLFFKLNVERLCSLIAENPQSSMGKTNKQESVKPADKNVGNPQTINKDSETTTETTTEITLSAPAREAVKIFEEEFGEPPHIHGQTDIERENITNPGLWRELCRQCRTNLMPAKNVGTIVRMYGEQVRREGARGQPRAGPRRSNVERSMEAVREFIAKEQDKCQQPKAASR